MNSPLPVQELRRILNGRGFLRLHGQDQTVFVSDAPRRLALDALAEIRLTMETRGFCSRVSPSGLLWVDLHPLRWEALLYAYRPAAALPFPDRVALMDVYELTRLLLRHPSPFHEQPMEPIRAMLKSVGRKNGPERLAPAMLKQCAERLRRKAPLPSALAGILQTWLAEPVEEARL